MESEDTIAKYWCVTSILIVLTVLHQVHLIKVRA
jgi:hypothetical protein